MWVSVVSMNTEAGSCIWGQRKHLVKLFTLRRFCVCVCETKGWVKTAGNNICIASLTHIIRIKCLDYIYVTAKLKGMCRHKVSTWCSHDPTLSYVLIALITCPVSFAVSGWVHIPPRLRGCLCLPWTEALPFGRSSSEEKHHRLSGVAQ